MSVSADVVLAEATALTRVYGRVVDKTTGQPIHNAYVVYYNILKGSFTATTNTSGAYEMEIDPGFYRVYAFCDLPATSGFDYVPASQFISLEDTSCNVSFALLPGASIHADGELNFFDLPPSPAVFFTVVEPSKVLNETNSVTRYGENVFPYPLRNLIGLTGRTVVVPSDTSVDLEVNVYYRDGSGWHFKICNKSLEQGGQLSFNIRNFALWNVADYVSGRLQFVQLMVDDLEKAGFYLYYENNRLDRAENLVESARSVLAEGDYDYAYADLHEAYIIIDNSEQILSTLPVSASQSVFLITPFMAFTAVALACTLFDGHRKRLSVGFSLYVALFGILLLFYPGYNTLQKSAYNPWAYSRFEGLLTPLLTTVSFLIALFVIQGLPIFFKEKTSLERLHPMSAIAAAFSIAARNLRRRKLRTLLASVLMLTSVFAFIILTSFSFEYGFSIQPQPGQAPSEGVLIRKPLEAGTITGEDELIVGSSFEPIGLSVLRWIEGRPEAALTVPMIENEPKIAPDTQSKPPLTTIYAHKSGSSFIISGALGVYPSLETQVTEIDSIISQGRFLEDRDLDGILISEEAAEELQVYVNDTIRLYSRSFNVTGIFSNEKFDALKDLDGLPISPQYFTVEIGPPGTLITFRYVPGEMVVVIHGETAQELPGMVVSRIDVQTGSPGEIMEIARLSVLFWSDFEAFASMGEEIQHLFIGSYVVAGGFVESIIPLILVVLNVGVMMLSAVYERKREVATMSSLGLNPFHITAVFVAEALVIGVVAGSLGYFLGLTSYRLMALLLPLGVKQKVEPVWGILVLSLSIAAAVLGSALPATKASIIVTPSLLKRWKIKLEEKPKTAGEPWLLKLPIQILEEDLGGFFEFVEKKLRQRLSPSIVYVDNLKVSEKELRLSFSYIDNEKRNIATENELFPVKTLLPNRYSVMLMSKTRRGTTTPIDDADVWQTANFIRNLILQYSAISRLETATQKTSGKKLVSSDMK
jgi:hypothetical protein